MHRAGGKALDCGEFFSSHKPMALLGLAAGRLPPLGAGGNWAEALRWKGLTGREGLMYGYSTEKVPGCCIKFRL